MFLKCTLLSYWACAVAASCFPSWNFFLFETQEGILYALCSAAPEFHWNFDKLVVL